MSEKIPQRVIQDPIEKSPLPAEILSELAKIERHAENLELHVRRWALHMSYKDAERIWTLIDQISTGASTLATHIEDVDDKAYELALQGRAHAEGRI